ncbi:hypothetical protein [Mucilaginibacter phyllosphaerae]|uniref:Uncharacterized protein n=1 Tax=Mucilaginibacter phyllosphaerae TaxID=1812349 RepID=A0A4Y8AF77_9SPHI|nr:hypothetical protein [Mucilaginibacter phyllosphaerae]MBB3968998.1 hypothetical protein [Mucilaginibacter phyllosphaerae]TEW67383.1 hypothetical protein E2R65_05175 [Mucilaginibacter phyllosphaerae]GGH23040.1 hypothetical protein GCM10007352_36740 [Mucilaginibacter phyllosphaerae]
MKKLTFTGLALLSLLFSACLKNDNCCTAPYQPYFVAEKNGLAVYGAPGSIKVGTDSVSVIGKSQDAGIRMHIKFTGKGIYALSGNQAKYYQKIANDTVSRYNIGIANGSQLEVTDYDSTAKVIAGKFTLKFKRTFPATSSIYPDSVKYTNGQFSVYLPR